MLYTLLDIVTYYAQVIFTGNIFITHFENIPTHLQGTLCNIAITIAPWFGWPTMMG